MADNYTVTGQRPTSVLDAAGHFVDVVEITFRTKSGDTGTLRIPVADYQNPDTVKGQLDALAAQMEYVRKL